ncbi:MAG: N-acetylmuramoyl-L-alanine amidase [Muribaculaceae bacterium]|nr:N-acetylmuramoyl-L-alanine amidase [Muribaculaceae bacterium]
MKLFRISTLALASIFFISSQAATPSLKITQGKKESTTKAQHTIVGITEPGNKAFINNKEVHVYKTGTFGDIVTLNEGDNTISIITKNASAETNSQEIKINYKNISSSSLSSKDPAARPKTTHINPALNIKTLPNAYLQFGDGSDRLGGSKMGYLEAEIPLKAIGQTSNLYLVQLSKNRVAYIPKEYVAETLERAEVDNSGSWAINNTGKTDRITISLPTRHAYQAWTQLDPTTICVDIFGVTNNSNWITQRNNLGMIEYVDWRQVDCDVLRVIIKLKDKYSWGYSVGYENNNLVINVKHCPSLNLKDLTIGLDAGHGGKYPGAIGNTGLKESFVNLDIVQRIKKLLEKKGAKVVLSRDSDVDITMAERKKIFRDANVDLMMSVHNNAGGSALKEMGTSTYFKHISNRDLAQCVLNRMLELGVRNFGLTGNFNFSLNAPTEYPNLLLEALFMSSLPEEELLADPDYRQRIAEQAVKGIEDYLKLVKQSKKK